jgi:serine/threonine protein kinase
MGEVYKAVDPRLGRFVAIKILLDHKLADYNHRRQFQQEARAASALNHPGIVTVYAGFDFSLWRMPVGGGAETQVVASLHRYNFAVTPGAVFFSTPSRLESPAELKKLDLATGRVSSLYTLSKRIDLGVALSPDNRYLLFAQLDYAGSDLMSVENFH